MKNKFILFFPQIIIVMALHNLAEKLTVNLICHYLTDITKTKILCHSFLFFQTNYMISNKEAVAHIKFLIFGNYSAITQCLSLKSTHHFKTQLKEIFYKTHTSSSQHEEASDDS